MWRRNYTVEMTAFTLKHVEDSKWGSLLCWYEYCMKTCTAATNALKYLLPHWFNVCFSWDFIRWLCGDIHKKFNVNVAHRRILTCQRFGTFLEHFSTAVRVWKQLRRFYTPQQQLLDNRRHDNTLNFTLQGLLQHPVQHNKLSLSCLVLPPPLAAFILSLPPTQTRVCIPTPLWLVCS